MQRRQVGPWEPLEPRFLVSLLDHTVWHPLETLSVCSTHLSIAYPSRPAELWEGSVFLIHVLDFTVPWLWSQQVLGEVPGTAHACWEESGCLRLCAQHLP